MPRRSEGLKPIGPRIDDTERQMLRDIAAHHGTSGNRGLRWAIRYAWQHATSTTDHSLCPEHSPCAGATRGLTPAGRQRATSGPEGQLSITHEATVED